MIWTSVPLQHRWTGTTAVRCPGREQSVSLVKRGPSRWLRRGLLLGGVIAAGSTLALLVAGALAARHRPPAGVLPALPRPIFFAHRGGAGEGPESTLPTMLETLAKHPGIALEFDLRQSRDGQIVVIHDATVDRTTNGTGRVADLTLAELQALDAGHCATPGRDRGTARRDACRDPARSGEFPLRGRGYRIPALDEVLAAVPASVGLGIEVKEGGFEARLAERLRRAGRSDRLVVGSAKDDVAAKLKAELPELAHFFPRWAGTRFALSAKLSGGRLSSPGYQVFAVPRAAPGLDLATTGVLATARRLGVLVSYFVINDEAEAERLLRLGAESLMTDFPSRMRAAAARAQTVQVQ